MFYWGILITATNEQDPCQYIEEIEIHDKALIFITKNVKW